MTWSLGVQREVPQELDDRGSLLGYPGIGTASPIPAQLHKLL